MSTVVGKRPNAMAPTLPALSPPAELALLARTLFRYGYDANLAGHITYRQDDGTLLVNPYGLTWDEVRASDVMRIDADGKVLEGLWTVSAAITLHLELHRARPDIQVAVHNHPRWATIWADVHRAPPVYDQTSALVAGDPAVYTEWEGSVDAVSNARGCVEALGRASMALLGNHGVLVVGNDVPQAYHRAAILEWRSRQAWHVETLGGGVPIRPELHASFASRFDASSAPGLFEATVRRELREDPSVLD